MSGALDGIRVLDLSTAMAEATGRTLADLGAEVLKIEPPEGCEARWTPPFVGGGPMAPQGDPEASLFWRAWGRGKRSLVLDLEGDEGREQLRALARSADILIESFVPGRMDELGLGPDSLRSINPALIYVSVSPFGQTGPYARHPATDLTLAAAGGLLHMQGNGDRPPIPVGLPETVHLGAVQAAADVLMALYGRTRTGRGQHLDCSLQAAVLWSLMFVTDYAALGQDPPGFGDDRAGRSGSMEVVPGLTLPVIEPCKDGYIAMTLVLGAQGAHGFDAAMRWVGEQGRLDPDLRQVDWRTWIQQIQEGKLAIEDANRGVAQLLAHLRGMTKAEIHARAVAQKWLIAPVNLAPDLLRDPQLRAREFWVEVEGASLPGPFARLSRTPIIYERGAPTRGQDQAMLAEWTQGAAQSASPPSRGIVSKPASERPLFEGLKVADFSWIAAGPLISKDLANLGATVLRVETEKRIDTLRFIPPWVGPPGTTTGHTAANMNQSKLGIAVDFTIPAGLEVAHRMAAWADVVIQNFTPGTAERLGLDDATLREKNPDLVLLYTCMRGQTGPERKHTGFGLHGAALAGFVGITGWPDRPPVAPWGAYTDFISPRYALAALVAALHHRDRTGEGQCIDVSQIESSIHYLAPMILDYESNGRVLDRAGLDSERGCPHGVFASRETERYVAIEVRSAEQWRALVSLVPGLEKVGGDELDSTAARLAKREEIDARLAAFCAGENARELGLRLRESGVPAYAVLRATDFHADAQLRDRGFFIELDHGGFGRSHFDGAVTIFSETPARPTRAGPLIGEHTFEVMRDILGYSDGEISEIAATGALT